MKVAHLGSAGAFSHAAARQAFGADVDYEGQRAIEEVFAAVAQGRADVGVVPIENSTEGAVTATMDSLLDTELTIQRELVIPIVHCLLAPHADQSRIRRVHSHPQALAQCRAWLREHLGQAELVAAASTTDAAARVARDRASDAAAIAGRLAAELFGLSVVEAGIQDQEDNVTRFLVIGRSASAATGRDKTSIAFATKHERGALVDVLGVFADAAQNLTRIESRPGRNRPWEYVFFVDIEGHRDDPGLATALELARQRSIMLKLFGSYPRGA